jgi:phosphoribosylformimino-5-aminoimidazole carboxamide ribotide isomerase
MEILPAIDLRDGKCVRLRQGDYNQETVFSKDPVVVARRWATEGATRLHLVDLDGARAGKPVNHEVVRKIVKAVGIPCQVGGGIRDEVSIRLLIESVGVDRVIVGTQALKQPDWFRAMVRLFPRKVALGIDARDSVVATEGWLDVSKTSAIELARQYVGLEIAGLIYTNIANDGMLKGIDEATVADLVRLAELGFPVIASGGVTTADDVRRLAVAAKKQPQLVGAIIGRALYEGTITVADAVVAAKEPV